MESTDVCGLLHCILFASSVSLKQAACYLQGIGCPSRRVLGGGHCFCTCHHLPNICSLQSAKSKYHSLHVLLINLLDRPAIGDIVSFRRRKEGAVTTSSLPRWEWGTSEGGSLPFTHVLTHASVSKAGRPWLCLCKPHPSHLYNGDPCYLLRVDLSATV